MYFFSTWLDSYGLNLYLRPSLQSTHIYFITLPSQIQGNFIIFTLNLDGILKLERKLFQKNEL